MGLQLIVPVIAAYIAYSIADKPGIAPGLIIGMLAAKMGTGFLGGIVVGFLVGYIANGIKRISVPDTLMPAMSILVVPVLSAFIVGMLMIYLVGVPIAALTKGLTVWLNSMSGTNAIVLSFILGMMMAFDMGGPINKVAYTMALAAFEAQAYVISSAVFIAISIPPLGLALASFLAPKKYTEIEREAAKSGVVMGIIGITEGAIPFAVADPIRVIPSIMLGSAVAAALGAALGVSNPTIMSTVLGIPFVSSPVLHILAVVVGVTVTALLVNFLKSEIKIEELENANTLGV